MSHVKGKYCRPENPAEWYRVVDEFYKFGYNSSAIINEKYFGVGYKGNLYSAMRVTHSMGTQILVDEFIELLREYKHELQQITVKADDVKIRRFPTGAIRSDNTGRERYDFISPLALKALAEYLATTENSFAQTNYFKGIPENVCVESMMRHLYDYQINGKKSEAIGMLFNAVALLHTIVLKERGEYIEKFQQTELINKSDFKDE